MNRVAAITSSAVAVLVLSACPPPNWSSKTYVGADAGGRVEPEQQPDVDAGPDVDGGGDGGLLVDAGDVDGGLDAGAVDGGDGGLVVDAGDVDGGLDAGDVDGGEVDGGDDGGLVVDAGDLDGGGLPIDAGDIDAGVDAGDIDGGLPPPCTFAADPDGWECATGSGSFPTACGTISSSPIVDFTNVCPTTFLLHQSGLVQAKRSGSLAVEFADCSAVALRPSIFTNLVAYDADTFIAYGRGERGICRIEGSICSCDVTTETVEGVAFPLVNRIVVGDGDGNISEFDVNPFMANQETISTGQLRLNHLTSATAPDQSRYRLAIYTDNGNACVDRIGTNPVSTNQNCPGAGDADYRPEFFDESEELNGQKTVIGFSGQVNVSEAPFVVGSGPLSALEPSALAEREPNFDPQFQPRSFAAAGDVGQANSRVAIGFAGGGLEVAIGATGGFSTTTDDYPSNSSELGPIREITTGVDSTQFPTNTHWAVSDSGVWFIPVNATQGDLVFTAYRFPQMPAAAQVVRINGAEVLVVGTIDGTIYTFDVGTDSVTPRDVLSGITASGAGSHIPEAIVAVQMSQWNYLLVTTTGGEVWVATYDNGAIPNEFELTSANRSFFLSGQGLNVTENDQYFIAHADFNNGSNGQAFFWVTTKEVNDFVVRRFGVSGSGGVGNVLFSAGARVRMTAPANTGPAFRFELDATNTNRQLIWTTDDGAVMAVPANPSGTLDESGRSTFAPAPPFSAGSYAVKTSNSCVVAFSADSTRWFAANYAGTGSSSGPTFATPGAYRFNVVVPVDAQTAYAGGDGGHLYLINWGSVCAGGTVDSITAPFDRLTSDITSLTWRGPDQLLVGDDRGRAWTVGTQ